MKKLNKLNLVSLGDKEFSKQELINMKQICVQKTLGIAKSIRAYSLQPKHCRHSIIILNYLFISLILLGCKLNHDQNKYKIEKGDSIQSPMIIDIARDFNNEREFRLSEIAYDIEYIKLESTPESLIGHGVIEMIVTDDYIYILNLNRLIQFDRTGKFIKQIGREGRGPGEVHGYRSITMDKENNILYVMANHKYEVLKYCAITGDYLRNFPSSSYIGFNQYNGAFQLLGNGTFAGLSLWMGQYQPDYTLIEIFDDEGNILKNKKSHLFSYQDNDKIEKRHHVATHMTWIFEDQLRLFEGINDTIYKLVDLELEPAYIFNLGKYKGPFDDMVGERRERYIRFGSFRETKSALYFLYRYNNEQITAKYSKDNDRIVRLLNPKGESNKIFNDLDGGLSIWPYYYEGQLENEWYMIVDAINMKQNLSPEYLKESESIYPEKKDDLKEFIEELSIEDNPVIMVVKLHK